MAVDWCRLASRSLPVDFAQSAIIMMAATGGAGNALAAHEFVDTREQVIVAVEEQVFEHPVAVAIPTYLAVSH